MAIRQRDKRNNEKLRRRLKYHGITLPTETKEERAKARGAITRAKNQKKERRSLDRLSASLDLYNDNLPPSKERHKIGLSDVALQDFSKRQRAELGRLVKALNKRKSVEKNREKLKDFLLKNGKGRKVTGREKQSIRGLSNGFENKSRMKRGMMTTLEETYYTNFLKACLRKGAYLIYRRALKGGYQYVQALYARGFDINEIYEFTEQGISDHYHDDDEIDAFMSGEKKVPKRSSEIGQTIARKYKVR